MRAFFRRHDGEVHHVTIEGLSFDENGELVMKRAEEVYERWRWTRRIWRSSLDEKARSIEIIP